MEGPLYKGSEFPLWFVLTRWGFLPKYQMEVVLKGVRFPQSSNSLWGPLRSTKGIWVTDLWIQFYNKFRWAQIKINQEARVLWSGHLGVLSRRSALEMETIGHGFIWVWSFTNSTYPTRCKGSCSPWWWRITIKFRSVQQPIIPNGDGAQQITTNTKKAFQRGFGIPESETGSFLCAQFLPLSVVGVTAVG